MVLVSKPLSVLRAGEVRKVVHSKPNMATMTSVLFVQMLDMGKVPGKNVLSEVVLVLSSIRLSVAVLPRVEISFILLRVSCDGRDQSCCSEFHDVII